MYPAVYETMKLLPAMRLRCFEVFDTSTPLFGRQLNDHPSQITVLIPPFKS